ncbi:MAG: hypothetical protein H6510_10590 [Acidobacteria bacterium]|nr:hypothetical protein [Acidobacteriota bacterium]MCB9398257.1 hypothetical protein [Acidobacteriota bacterium]
MLKALLARTIIITLSVVGLAQDNDWANSPERAKIRENVQVIKTFKRDQHLIDLAKRLQLDSAQVQHLRQIKAQCEQIRDQKNQEEQPLTQQMLDLTSQLRKQVESGQTPDPNLEREIKAIHKSLRQVHTKTKLALQLACVELPDILSENQVQTIKEFARDHKQNEKRAERGAKRGDRIASPKARLARALLSDTFLAQYPQ